MIRIFTFLALFLLHTAFATASELLQGDASNQHIQGTSKIWYKDGQAIPAYIEFKVSHRIPLTSLQDWLYEKLSVDPALQLVLLRSITDKQGMEHYTYQLFHGEVPVEFSRFKAHVVDGMVHSMNGNIFADFKIRNSSALDVNTAFSAALEYFGAEEYKWNVPAEENRLKFETKDPNATYLPKGERVLVTKDGVYDPQGLRYAYRFDIFSERPLKRSDVYVDAESGEILLDHQQIHTSDTTGIAHTGYSNTQQIKTTRMPNTHFRLAETERGGGITTYNLQRTNSYSNAVDFTDEDNVWNNVNPQLDQFATDAHWGSEMTYDYFFLVHGRDSYNGNGREIISYVHFGENFANAFWDGRHMVYGDGNGAPFTSLDIAGHEIAHGVTQHAADLNYYRESGALNESFSDIFGTAIEFYAKQGSANWTIGEDLGYYIRSMSNPNVRNDPDTYDGAFWYTGNQDNGGVHINSGVQNYWFYLLSEGGTGVNDNGDHFDVDKIGIDNAAAIAYRNLTVYLNPQSDYQEAMFYGTQSAIDLYGRCSSEHKATVNAWYAVGLGSEFEDGVQSRFEVDNQFSCTVPFTVHFKNLSNNGLNYRWEFGDGTTSDEVNPSHIYTTEDEFDVTLIVDGSNCGRDTLSLSSLIKVLQMESPETDASDKEVFEGESATLHAESTSGDLVWYNDAGEEVHRGTHFVTPPLSQTTTYHVERREIAPTQNVGEMVDQINGVYSEIDAGLMFDVYQAIELQSIFVDAEDVGNRLFEVKDVNGKVIASKMVNLHEGEQRVDLNFFIPVGTDYRLGLNTSHMRGLFRNDQSNFPYLESGLVSINSNDIPAAKNIYFYFYDWEVKRDDCVSDRIAVEVAVKSKPVVTTVPYNFYVSKTDGLSYHLDLYMEEAGDVVYKLYGINGQLVVDHLESYEEGQSSTNLNELLDLNKLTTGVYFLGINGNGVEKTEKIVIERKE